MIVPLQVPRWSSDRWGSRGGWSLILAGALVGLLAVTGVVALAMLSCAVPAVVLGRRLRVAPEVEHLRELDPWGSPEGLNCSFTGLTSRPRPRFPNLLVRVAEPRLVPEARSGWLGPWPLAVLVVPSPYLMPRPSRA